MTDYKTLDMWTGESFEDIITRTMVALYETKVHPRCATTSRLARFTVDDMLRIRRHGVTVAAPDRLFLAEGDMKAIDEHLATIPASGCISFGEDLNPADPDHMDSYCSLIYFRRVPKLPRKAAMLSPGLIYEIIRVYPQERGEVMGMRDFVTVNPLTRRITACMELGHRPRAQMLQHTTAPPHRAGSEELLNFSTQYVDDLRHQWRITALTEETKVTVGAYAENVKSLLYARTLPMTPTGRKRPILHVVHAHRRRLQEGTEIDIDQFLRGTREIEMDGTLFKVDAPQRLIDEMLATKDAKAAR